MIIKVRMVATFGGRWAGTGRKHKEDFCALANVLFFLTWMVVARVFVLDKSLSCMVLFLPSTPPFFGICVVFHNKKGKQREWGERIGDREHTQLLRGMLLQR